MVRGLLGATTLIMVAACGQVPTPAQEPVTSSAPSPTPTPSATPAPTATPSDTCPAEVPARLSLQGEEGRAFAFAPAGSATKIIVEGSVDDEEAWSTSKVLVAAAFLDTAAEGDPDRVSAADRRLITAALSRSDVDAVRALRQQIQGSPGRAMTRVLRSIGDDTTTAPDSYEGEMLWSIREQVRFMAALQDGKVVSRRASAYLLDEMRPIDAHSWGLGEVGARTFKGGWLRRDTATRQMGILDGYAVAIITDRGPVVRQTDGDTAHVEVMNDLARLLADRLAFERHCG